MTCLVRRNTLYELKPEDYCLQGNNRLRNAELRSGNTMVMVYSPGCHFCQEAKPQVEEAVKYTQNCSAIARINIANLHEKLRSTIEGVPTFFLYKNGEVVGKYNGPREAHALANTVSNM